MEREPATDRAASEPWTGDTAAFNRWLCTSRLRSATSVLLFFPLLKALGMVDLHVAPVLAACAALIFFALAGFATQRRTEESRAFLWLQMVVDLACITAGIGFATRGAGGSVALVARLLYVVAIVPASLISVPMGLGVSALAIAGHGLLLVVDRGATAATFASFDFLAPSFLFLLVAQQSFFYGNHVRKKNAALAALAQRLEMSQQRLAEEGRLAAGVAEIARTLSATLDDPKPLARVVGTIRERLGSDWAAMFAVEEAGFRLVAITDPEIAASDVGRFSFPFASWPAVEQLGGERALVLREDEVARMPISFRGGEMLRSALLTGLYRDGAMVGFLAVGYCGPIESVDEGATHLLAGIAEHTSVVLQNSRLLDEVRAASALKSEFVGAVSHELRSPLNVILGYIEMMLDRALGPLTLDQLDALRRSEAYASTLLEMIETLLDLNRIEAGRLPLERSAVSVEQLLGEVCEQLERTFSRQGVDLRREIAAPLPPILTDPGKLKTIVRNLVHNALKFTAQGSVTVVAAPLGRDRIAIVVEDTGCGIPDGALTYIFDMFRQVPGSGGGGVGLGLYIVRRLSDAIGATVSVTSRVGVGTRFTLVLPDGAVEGASRGPEAGAESS